MTTTGKLSMICFSLLLLRLHCLVHPLAATFVRRSDPLGRCTPYLLESLLYKKIAWAAAGQEPHGIDPAVRALVDEV